MRFSYTLPKALFLIVFGMCHFALASPNEGEKWNIHFQATLVPQYHPAFSVLYSGVNSLSPNSEFDTSFTSTLFLGGAPWKGAELYFNPEVSAGSGFSATHGVAGFPNGEIYRVDTPNPRPVIARLFLRQDFGLGGPQEWLESDKNQLGAKKDISRLSIMAGKFSLNDYFDNNTYSHDPRTQFLNWALMDTGAWDYAADTRGYTIGFMLEFNQPSWAIRFASALEPKVANMLEFDDNIAQAHGDNLEFEYRYKIQEHPGKVRLLGFMNHAHMGSYQEALAASPVNPDIAQTRAYRIKYGFGINFEQELTPDLGCFARLGWDDGRTETWAFTEIDQTLAMGISLKGNAWNRPQDTFGLALIVNGLSADHAHYLAAGGIGFLIGDGGINYAPEDIVESYYALQVSKYFSITADYQWINHPAYNQDRGSASVLGGRIHYEF